LKEADLTQYERLSWYMPGRTKKNNKSLYQHSQCTSWHLNHAHPKYNRNIITSARLL